MAQTLILTWTDIESDVADLARTLEQKGPWKGLIAITRGGMVPAALLGYQLNIRDVDTLCIVSYGEDKIQREADVLRPPQNLGDGAGWLVIDDLTDTGDTAAIVRGLLPRAFLAVLYVKPMGRPSVDHFVKEIPQDTWLVFPWEKGE